MELRNLESFVAAVEYNNFSKAAKALGYTQSTVTVHISQLEEEFDTLLFERIGKTVHLTKDGELFYSQAKKILNEVDSTRTAMSKDSEPCGTLRLGTVASLSTRRLPSDLLRLHESFPRIKVIVDSEDPAVLLRKLRRNELDILYMVSDQIEGSDLVTALERKEPLHFIVAPDHPLVRRKKVTFDDILGEEQVLTVRGMLILRRVLGDKQDLLSPYLISGMPDIILRTVAGSRAVSLVPDYISAPAVSAGEVVRLDVDGIDEEFEMKVVYHKNKWVSPEMEAFISILP